MSNEMHWGGINGKSLLKAVVSDIWMVFAVMVITYLALGIVGHMRYTPSYTSSAVVAVYPYDRMYTPETSSDALATVGAANEVFNSEMFRTGLAERLTGSADFSLYSRQIDRTYILMLSASGSSPENAYRTLRTALEYYEEISSHLVGDTHLEVLSDPDFPTSADNGSNLLKRRPFLTLFMGFAAGCFLILMYAVRKTYKTPSAVRRSYKDVRFFMVRASASEKHDGKNRKRSVSVPERESVRKTALELMQTLRAKNADSVFVTSAARGEGKTEIVVSLAGELADAGRSVVILATDPENSEMSEYPGVSGKQQRYTVSELLRDRFDLADAARDITDRKVRVLFANRTDMQDDFHDAAKDAERLLEKAGKIADVVLVDGCVWTGSGDERNWKEAADASLAVCRQDKAEFYAIDRMMTDLREDESGFLGCVLYGF